MTEQWQKSRNLKERIKIDGKLELLTPTHIGNGDSDDLLDMPLLRDLSSGQALIPGSSLAGALRAYLAINNAPLAELLFGGIHEKKAKESWLIIDDALGTPYQNIHAALDYEIRDGVAIDIDTRTAEDKKKYDYELVTAGTIFDLSIELLVPRDYPEFESALAVALTGLENGSICLGKRKRRGFGKCKINSWVVSRYDMTTPKGMIEWLENTPCKLPPQPKITQLLNPGNILPPPVCEIEATFYLDNSILIRSEADRPNSPDAIHLHSKRKNGDVPVISGTSVAGALRSRTIRIGNTLGMDGKELANEMFGLRRYDRSDKSPLTASRLWIEECEVVRNGGNNPLEQVHTRLEIDRFTGGAYPNKLFSEQPVYATPDTSVTIKMRMDKPDDKYFGLMILLLKDLWTGDIPIGGESSVGRGCLNGNKASLKFGNFIWDLEEKDGKIIVTPSNPEAPKLQGYVNQFTGRVINEPTK